MTSDSRSFHIGILFVIAFVMGGCGIAYEYTFSKLSSDLLGNSVQQWAIIIGLMMLCMGIGSDIQKHIADSKIFAAFIVIELILGVVGGFGPVGLLAIFGISRDHFAVLQYTLIIVAGLCIGLEIPLLARLNEVYMPQLKRNLGAILRMDYIGAFAGALVWIFLLTRFFSITEMGFVLGIINVAVAGSSLVFLPRIARYRMRLAPPVLLCLVVLVLGLVQAPSWTAYAEQHLFRHQIILSETSPYQHIVLTRAPQGDIACYINGHLQFHSIDEHIYHENLVHPVMAAARVRTRVLVLGGGDGLAVRELRKYHDISSMTLVDIDPAMSRLAMTNEHFLRLNDSSMLDPRLVYTANQAIAPGRNITITVPNRARPLRHEQGHVADLAVINLDAAAYIRQVQGLFDIIILDFPDPSSLELTKLYSRSFYEAVRSRLTPGGLIVQQAGSPFYTRRAFVCIGLTMASAGLAAVPYHDNVPSFGEWGFWIAGQGDYHGSDAIAERLAGIDSLSVPVRYLNEALIKAGLTFPQSWLDTSGVVVNTIVNNVIFQYYSQDVAKLP